MAVPYGENQYIYGLHDPGGENLLMHEGKAKGWVLVTEEIRANPVDSSGKGDFYKRLADQGFGVIVRLNHAYGLTAPFPSRRNIAISPGAPPILYETRPARIFGLSAMR